GSDVIICENVTGCGGVSYGAPMTSPAPTSLPPQEFTASAMSPSNNRWSPAQAATSIPFRSTAYNQHGFAGLSDPDIGNCESPCRVSACNSGVRCLPGDVNGDGRIDQVCEYYANDVGD